MKRTAYTASLFMVCVFLLLSSCNAYSIEPEESSVMLDRAVSVLAPGETMQLSASYTGSASSAEKVWSSSVPASATVSGDGLVTAAEEGTACITLTAGSCSASCAVTVKKPAARSGAAWEAAAAMGFGVNIGNTLENTTAWETGWGQPKITKTFIHSLKSHGFRSVRVPVAWNTFADNGTITETEFSRVGEVIDWITAEGMYCIVNIHWDGGWIDNDNNNFPGSAAHTLTDTAKLLFSSYWTQIASRYKDKNSLLIFEALNEESNFSGESDPYEPLNYLNRTFVDIVRSSGGNNTDRLLLVAGYCTDITNSCAVQNGTYRLVLPDDTAEHRLLVSVHYYTPWTFCGLETDASWGKVQSTWGSADDVMQLASLFTMMDVFCTDNDCPAVIGEFGVTTKRAAAYRTLWMKAVAEASLGRQMVPMLWDTGSDVYRSGSCGVSGALEAVLASLGM
jgi:endoglucanase